MMPLSYRLRRFGVASLFLTLLGGCALFNTNKEEQHAFYSLHGSQLTGQPSIYPSAQWSTATPTLIVNPPHAAAGFDSNRIIYVRERNHLEYFAHSQWVDTPARMITPSIVAALENTGAFQAVILTPSAAAGDLRLDVEILRLQHEFGSPPSQVRFTLRAYLVDNETRRVLAWRELEETAEAAQANTYGGVLAANNAVQKVVDLLANFCAEISMSWITATSRPPAGGR